MGIATAKLNGNIVTDAHLTIPAWGASYHDVTVDGEVNLTGAVTLVVADLTIQCTVLSGGAAKGRSFFRLISGAGGWGQTLPKRSYSNDAGVKLATVLTDAAGEVGETIDPATLDTSIRLGPYFTRPEQPACRLLELISPNAWYVGEDGITRLGARPASSLTATATATSQIDLARGTVTLASETIAGILPGIVVDGLTAVDVEHEVSAKGGLRSKLWGQQGSGTSRRLAAFRSIVDQLDPDRLFRGVYEYRVVTITGNRLNLQPVQVSTGMPDLQRVVVRPGVGGAATTPALGSRVLVGFVNADPARPAVLAFEDPDGAGFSPSGVTLNAGSHTPTEHVITAEATCLIVYNFLAALCAANSGPFTGAGLATQLATAMTAALTPLATSAPAGQAAQVAAAAAQAANFTAGTVASTSSPFNAAIAAAAAAKTDDVSGLFPAAGCPDVKAG